MGLWALASCSWLGATWAPALGHTGTPGPKISQRAGWPGHADGSIMPSLLLLWSGEARTQISGFGGEFG